MVLMQEAFETRMGEFVSRCRERQRYIRLRSQERCLQQSAATERRHLFGDVQLQRSALSLSEPAVGMPARHFCMHLLTRCVLAVGALTWLGNMRGIQPAKSTTTTVVLARGGRG